jgi:hypothetical protein
MSEESIQKDTDQRKCIFIRRKTILEEVTITEHVK